MKPSLHFTPTRNQHGFTLIETLVAIVLIMIAVAALAQLLAVGLSMNTYSRSGTNATAIAQSRLDDLKRKYNNCLQPPATSCSDADLTDGDHTDATSVVIQNPNNSNEQYNVFTVSWTVRVLDQNWNELAAGSAPNLKTTVEIDVRVVPQNPNQILNKMVVVHTTFAPAVNLS